MAIKKLTFSFEVPITQLLGLIATGNSGLKIDVLGDDRPPPQRRLNGHNGVKLLEGPKRQAKEPRIRSTNGVPSWLTMLEVFAKNPAHTERAYDLGKVLVANGLSAKSVSPQLTMMQNNGFLTRVGQGTYKLTASGIREAIKRGYKIGHPPTKKKPPAKKKPAAAPAPAAEVGHG